MIYLRNIFEKKTLTSKKLFLLKTVSMEKAFCIMKAENVYSVLYTIRNTNDGFYYYASESMGLVPLESVTFLGDDDIERSIDEASLSHSLSYIEGLRIKLR
ncbi:hypothetical protein J41TS4_31570 [Paenibacillus apis]|uniref:Uncharacterized protein n=1 Tax=Paenibacillus apis TaxID=1792174 RepID=A0A919Y2R0_9BACL|nr:hypothetical protein J41TS4_31570 [Paenibacillus apis]